LLAALLLGGLAGPALAADCVSGTAYTAAAVCTVPAGMNSMTVTVIGGGGGSGFCLPEATPPPAPAPWP
jgi:hypothetical protein